MERQVEHRYQFGLAPPGSGDRNASDRTGSPALGTLHEKSGEPTTRAREVKTCHKKENKAMTVDRAEDLNHGMQLIPQLAEVMPEQADERIRPIYEDIRATLHVPFVNFIFRSLANYPQYLESTWTRVSPRLRTRAFERAADDVRSQALLEPVPDVSDVERKERSDLDRIRSFTDAIHYVLPKLVLIASALDEELQGRRPYGGSAESRGRNGQSIEIPLGPVIGMTAVAIVDPSKTTGTLHELFEKIKQRHNHPGVATYYRALGNWSQFLQVVWERLDPIVGAPPYEQRKHRLIKQAGSIVYDLPLIARSMGDDVNMPAEQIAKIRSILAVFRYRLIPDLLLDVA